MIDHAGPQSFYNPWSACRLHCVTRITNLTCSRTSEHDIRCQQIPFAHCDVPFRLHEVAHPAGDLRTQRQRFARRGRDFPALKPLSEN